MSEERVGQTDFLEKALEGIDLSEYLAMSPTVWAQPDTYEEIIFHESTIDQEKVVFNRCHQRWPTHSEENIRQQYESYKSWCQVFKNGLDTFLSQGLAKRSKFEKLGILLPRTQTDNWVAGVECVVKSVTQ